MRVILELTMTKLQARDSVYWPDMNKEIEILVKTCDVCKENAQKEC